MASRARARARRGGGEAMRAPSPCRRARPRGGGAARGEGRRRPLTASAGRAGGRQEARGRIRPRGGSHLSAARGIGPGLESGGGREGGGSVRHGPGGEQKEERWGRFHRPSRGDACGSAVPECSFGLRRGAERAPRAGSALRGAGRVLQHRLTNSLESSHFRPGFAYVAHKGFSVNKQVFLRTSLRALCLTAARPMLIVAFLNAGNVQ